ncbi:aldehyde dehydrogenase family protein [Pikeienuella sp. HZG-20]|uniref:aldehyde dehydrogenase family protein n=1 Tax=Paludibacillus litoralis TaxID=3133267 RepID=UPI0030ED6C71
MADMIRCISPVDGSLYAERPASTVKEAGALVASARAAQKDWAARPLAERASLVRAGVEALAATAEDATPEIAWQMGRPVRYGGEFGGVRERAGHMADIAEAALAPMTISDDEHVRRVIRREPHGVTLTIAPWNYPYLTAINTVAPALIAGNAVLLKAAAQTLLTGERMVAAFREAGMPEDVFQAVFLTHQGTADLLAKRAFDAVSFTGSVGGGRAIEKAAAGTFVPLNLELGGKDPAYVLEDADLDAAAETLIDGAMFNSGQCCCGIERIYVAAPLFDRFIEKAVGIVNGYVLGNPLDPKTTLGPMAKKRFAELVRRQVAAAVDGGARKLIDPARFPEAGGAYLAPQILVDVDHTMELMREENFGPVVGIMKVDSDDEAVRLMNDSNYGLTASLWTGDVERAERLGARIEAGTVFMNRCDYLDPALCWTGCKDSGRGGALSVIGYHNLTRPKSYHLKKV